MGVNAQGALTETDQQSASLFRQEDLGNSDEFKFRLDGSDPKYIAATRGKDQVQVTEDEHLLRNFSLEDENVAWGDLGARIKTEDGRYLGYCLKNHVMKCFPSGTEVQPGAILLDCNLEKKK